MIGLITTIFALSLIVDDIIFCTNLVKDNGIMAIMYVIVKLMLFAYLFVKLKPVDEDE